MDKQEFKRILAGISIAGLLAGTTIGCTQKTQETTETTPPAQESPTTEETTPDPGSLTGSEEGAGGTEEKAAPGS